MITPHFILLHSPATFQSLESEVYKIVPNLKIYC